MAAVNFPNNPSVNDTHTSSGSTWKWDGGVWQRLGVAGPQGAQGAQGRQGATGAQGHQGVQGAVGAQGSQGVQGAVNNLTIATSPPGSPTAGDMWWDSDDGDLHTYFNDGNSSQWVNINNGPAGAQGAQGRQGAAGAAGAQGAQGRQGATGAAGAQGAQGHQGVQGAANATTINNNANNRLITGSGTANTLEAEANFTYDGNLVSILSSSNQADGLYIHNTNNSQGHAHAAVMISGGDNASAFLRLENNSQKFEIIKDANHNLVVEDDGTERLRLKSDGNLGIGDDNPGQKLSVKNAAACIVQAQSTNNNTSAIFQCLGKNSSGTSRLAKFCYDNADEVRIITDSAIPIKFMISNAEKLRITSSGQIKKSQGANVTSLKTYNSHADAFWVDHYQYQVSSTYQRYTDIVSIGDGTWGSNIRFFTNANGSQNGQMTLIITDDGKIGLNESDPVGHLVVRARTDDNPAIIIFRSSGGGDVGSLAWRTSNGTNAYINWRGGGTAKGLQFYTSTNGNDGSTVERFRINANSNGSAVASYGTGTTHYNQCSTPDRASFKIGGMLHVDGAFGNNAMCGLYYNCYSGGNDLFYGGTYTPSGNDRRASAVVMRYGGVCIYTDSSSTGYTSQQQITTMSKRFDCAQNGRIRVPVVYSTNGSNMREVEIESDGNLCAGNTSIRAAKKNIVSQTDVSWLYDLNPVTFNYRKHNEDQITGERTYLDEVVDETSYGLIAEEVEVVKKDFCFYNKDNDDNDVLAGVAYKQLITPLLKALQDQNKKIEVLEAKVAALEG